MTVSESSRLVCLVNSQSLAPSAAYCRATWPPTKPVAPVIKTRTSRSFPTHPGTAAVPTAGSEMQALVQLLRLDLDIPLARRLLLPVLLHPGFEGLTGCCVAASKSKSGDIGIGNVHLAWRVGRDDANEGIVERVTGTPIEEVAHDLRTVLACHPDI